MEEEEEKKLKEDTGQAKEVEEPKPMKVSKSQDNVREGVDEEQEANELRDKIMEWIEENKNIAEVELKLVSDFLLEFTIGPLKMPFQVGTDEQWRPMFMTSPAPLLADYLTPINIWMEDQMGRESFGVTELLTHIAIQFSEVQSAVMQGNMSEEMGKKLSDELAKLMAQEEVVEKKVTMDEPEKKVKMLAKEYGCPFCQDEFVLNDLRFHLAQHAEEDKRQVCPVCADEEEEGEGEDKKFDIVEVMKKMEDEGKDKVKEKEKEKQEKEKEGSGGEEKNEEKNEEKKEEKKEGEKEEKKEEKTKKGEPVEDIFAHFAAKHHVFKNKRVPKAPIVRVKPSVASFADEIIPEMRRRLEGQHMQPYEVEEWVRRVEQAVQKGDLDKGLRIVRDEALGGDVPAVLDKYMAEPLLEQMERLRRQRRYDREGLCEEAWQRLESEAESLRESGSELLGFTAAPIGNSLCHWELTLLGYAFFWSLVSLFDGVLGTVSIRRHHWACSWWSGRSTTADWTSHCLRATW